VRNLSSQKGFTNRPGRCCRKKMGRPMDNQTSTLTPMNRGDRTTSPQSATLRSNMLLIQNRQPRCLVCIAWTPPPPRKGGTSSQKTFILCSLPRIHLYRRSSDSFQV
jgi:hypothetical protein